MPVETELYEILEIHVSASQDEIKRAYRKKALTHHPDKGGDPEVFKKINSAHEILSDPEKREIYDKHGKNGLRESGGIPDDILSAIFGSMGGGIFGMFQNHFNQPNHSSRQTRKTPTVAYTHMVSLEDLCTRKIVKLKVNRERICKCFNESSAQSCSQCSGKGIRVQIISLGPFQQHIQQPCDTCQALGKIYKTCDKCVGRNGLIEDSKVFELYLNPELENGYRYTFPLEGNQMKGCESGDFVIILEYTKHPAFHLDGKKMTYHHTITLKEALCGHTLCLTHPSGEPINIQTTEVINPDTIKVIEKKGLTEDTNLEIRYKIVFPVSLSCEQVNVLSKNL